MIAYTNVFEGNERYKKGTIFKDIEANGKHNNPAIVKL
jgi:hypothetical protein